MTTACLPFDDWRDVVEVPPGVDVVTYDGVSEPPDLGGIELYVPQYMASEHTLTVMRGMKRLQVSRR